MADTPLHQLHDAEVQSARCSTYIRLTLVSAQHHFKGDISNATEQMHEIRSRCDARRKSLIGDLGLVRHVIRAAHRSLTELRCALRLEKGSMLGKICSLLGPPKQMQTTDFAKFRLYVMFLYIIFYLAYYIKFN